MYLVSQPLGSENDASATSSCPGPTDSSLKACSRFLACTRPRHSSTRRMPACARPGLGAIASAFSRWCSVPVCVRRCVLF